MLSIVLLCTALSSTSWAAVIAELDRTEITIEDTLSLTIRVTDDSSGEPNLEPLRNDFEILRNGKSSQFTITNGRSQRSTEWQLVLAPKRQGELFIPPISVGKEKTQMLSLRVTEARSYASNANAAPVFVESEVDKQQVYEQEQILFTVRVHHAVQLDNLNLSEPSFDNALITKLDQNSFRRTINGQTYRVHEVKYALFPQETGEFVLPEQVFTAEIPVPRRSLFDFPGQGKPVRKLTKQHSVSVMPRPQNLASQTWLPAKALEATDEWSLDKTEIPVGESITRTITVTAKGLTAAQLPPLNASYPNSVKVYPDQPQRLDQTVSDGVEGTLISSTAIIATAAGELRFPAIRIAWWDTQSNQPRETIIPEKVFSVTGQLPQSMPSAQSSSLATETALGANTTDEATPALPSHSPSWLFYGMATLGYVLWLITLFFWWKSKPGPDSATGKPVTATQVSKKQAFKQFKAACLEGNAQQARNTLLVWANLNWPDQQFTSLSELTTGVNSPALRQQCLNLNDHLYGKQSGNWQGQGLLDAINQIQNQNTQKTSPANGLNPLYPSL